MDEAVQVPQLEAPAPRQSQGEQAVKEGDANKASALNAVDKARENLGHVAAEHEVHTDASGVVLTPREVEDVQAHGNQ